METYQGTMHGVNGYLSLDENSTYAEQLYMKNQIPMTDVFP